MHVALIVDEERLVHEHTSLNRLSIGLIGEGVQLTRIIPDELTSQAVDQGEQRVALAAKIQTPMRVLPWSRRDRTDRIFEAMEKEPPDVIYALGEEAWDLGRDMAKAMDRPLAVDVCSAVDVRRVPRGRAASAVACYITPTGPIAALLRKRVDPGLICHVPMGVALPAEPRKIFTDPDSAIALAIVGSARDVPAYRALLGGLSRVTRKMPQVQAFLELCGPNEHEIWLHARRLDLMGNVSAITDAARHRALLTKCDILLMPERYGELSSLLLESMAFGIPVIAGDDPFLDMLVDGESAIIIKQADAEGWARQLQRLLTDPDAARSLGQAGREHVATHHRSSDQVSKLIKQFQRIVGGGVYQFELDDG